MENGDAFLPMSKAARVAYRRREHVVRGVSCGEQALTILREWKYAHGNDIADAPRTVLTAALRHVASRVAARNTRIGAQLRWLQRWEASLVGELTRQSRRR